MTEKRDTDIDLEHDDRSACESASDTLRGHVDKETVKKQHWAPELLQKARANFSNYNVFDG